MSHGWPSRAQPVRSPPAFKERTGWQLKRVSSVGSDVNCVSYTRQDIDAHKPSSYNYHDNPAYPDEQIELHGLSSVCRNDSGTVCHTYSTYARGGDTLRNAYDYLDITPKGRNEDQIIGWMRLHNTDEAPEPARVWPV